MKRSHTRTTLSLTRFMILKSLKLWMLLELLTLVQQYWNKTQFVDWNWWNNQTHWWYQKCVYYFNFKKHLQWRRSYYSIISSIWKYSFCFVLTKPISRLSMFDFCVVFAQTTKYILRRCQNIPSMCLGLCFESIRLVTHLKKEQKLLISWRDKYRKKYLQ